MRPCRNALALPAAILLFACLVSAFTPATVRAEGLSFAVIQPGQPGTPEEAQPVMDQLAAYLKAYLGRDVTGSYVNDLDKALEMAHSAPPDFAIVSLGFYMEYGKEFHLTPIASTMPGGKASELWRLAAPKEGPQTAEGLSGEVRGTMLYTPDAAACLVFGRRAAELPFALKGTDRPLRAIRNASRGKLAGVILDGMQFSALGAVPAGKDLSIIKESGEIPTSPVVWFGPADETSGLAAKVLQAMGVDPDAAGVLKLLTTEGFAKPNPTLENLRMDAGHGCPKP